MKNQKFLKIAGVLLLSAVLLFSASAVTANTTTLTTSFKATGQSQGSQSTSRDVIWDNGYYTTNLLASQQDLVYPFNAQTANDFQLSSAQTVTEVIFWGGFWNGAPPWPDPLDYNIIFYADDGSGNQPPGAGSQDPTPNALLVDTHTGVSGVDNGDGTFTYDLVLNTPFAASANTKYWVVFQAIMTFPPQWGWAASDTVLLHSAMTGFPLAGAPYWTDLGYGDTAFQLLGGGGADTTPPETTCVITGTNPVTITLTATDADSGVNFTKYKIDDGAYATYTAPVIVTEAGDHVVYFYSVDKAGNIETEKNKAFTVEAPSITITIKGGLGVSATIKNTGTTDLTNINWTINLDGKLIFVGKARSGTIAALAPGESKTVKDFVIGFGKTGIIASAGDAEASASGTVLLFFVIGVA
jgi:hypothetical protein